MTYRPRRLRVPRPRRLPYVPVAVASHVSRAAVAQFEDAMRRAGERRPIVAYPLGIYPLPTATAEDQL